MGQGEAWKERFYWARSASKGICGLPLVEIQKTGATSISYTPTIDLFDYDIDKAKSILRKYDLVVVGSDTILEKVTGGSQQLGLNWGSSELCNAPHVFSQPVRHLPTSLTTNLCWKD